MAKTKPAAFHLTLALLVALASTFTLASSQLVFAGGTPASGTVTDQLITQEGAGAGTSVGDYVGSSGGLNTYYSYFIEVPAGLSQLTVDIGDADVGTNAFNNDQLNERDRARGLYDTCVRYTLYRPDGTQASNFVIGPAVGCFLVPFGTCPTCDNAWQTLRTEASPQSGHWELRVDMSSVVTSGDDVNAFGIRAHDGTPGPGGTELNVYAASFHIVGINDNGRSRSYTTHPYVTSGCSADVNDFDWDAAGGNPYGSLSLASRLGAFTHNNSTMSANNTWQNANFAGWTSDSSAHDYEIWTSGITISSTLEPSANYGVVYLGDFAASAPPPSAQPEANTFRVYLPTDAGGAPSKPHVRQYLTHVSGPNPPEVSQTSRISVTVEVVNPSGSLGAISFSSPRNLVTANVPGGQVVYAGNASATGTIVSQPAVGGSGNILWNPGTVATGATATLSYEVDVTPASPGVRVPVTGSPLSNGTGARYLDETGNALQARATYTFGPLCELAVTPGEPTAVTLTSLTANRAHVSVGQQSSGPNWSALAIAALVALSPGALRPLASEGAPPLGWPSSPSRPPGLSTCAILRLSGSDHRA